MPIEIDMLSIGRADSIIIHAYDGYQRSTVLIDGGNSKDADTILNHLYKWGGGKIDLLINTHPDNDHIGGLPQIIDELPPKHILIHDPSAHPHNVRELIDTLALSTFTKHREVAKTLSSATDLIKKIDKMNIPRSEPFAGVWYQMPDNTRLNIIGPSQSYYQQLLAGMKEALDKIVFNRLHEMLKASQPSTDEEIVDENNETSPSNDSSAVALLTHGGKRYLFTGDAGHNSLSQAHDYADLSNLNWMQVPHHGSRRNLTTNLISTFAPSQCFISAGKDDEKHPNKAIVNLLKKTGSQVFATLNNGHLHHRSAGVQSRIGYSPATAL